MPTSSLKRNKNCIFHHITTDAVVEGNRIFEIINTSTYEKVFSDTIYLDRGINKVNLNVQLEEGFYEILTNEAFNIESFGFPFPILYSETKNIDYPYYIGDLITIQGSKAGEETFPYFFDWHVSPLLNECTSDIFEIVIDLDTTSSLQY